MDHTKRYRNSNLSQSIMGLGLVLCILMLAPNLVRAEQHYVMRMFFGLSLPGGGGVSLKQWNAFEQDQIAKRFEGFNVADSVGHWKGSAERAKILTLILPEGEISRAKELARIYASTFEQDSVLVVVSPITEMSFVTPTVESDKEPLIESKGDDTKP